MATLTSSDFQEMRQIIQSNPNIKAAFKALALSKSTWYALFQAIEDWFVNGFTTRPATSLKAEIDTAAGITTTAGQAKQVVMTWIKWRFGKDL